MLLTVYLAIVILAAVTVMMLSAVAFIQDEKMFSSAPKEVRKLIRPRKTDVLRRQNDRMDAFDIQYPHDSRSIGNRSVGRHQERLHLLAVFHKIPGPVHRI